MARWSEQTASSYLASSLDWSCRWSDRPAAGLRSCGRPLESAHDSKQVNRLHTFLPRLWRRGRHPDGYRARLPASHYVHRGRSRRSTSRRHRSAGRGPVVGTQPVQHLPAESASILQQEGQAKIFPRGRPCAPTDPVNSQPTQAVGPLGGPLHCQQGARKRLLLPDRCSEAPSAQKGRLWQRDITPVECKSSSKILQLMQYVSRYPFVLKY